MIYDPATTRPNPNGTGFIRDPFPNNQIPVSRFSQLAKNYVALARNVVVPNQAGTPGTFAYINNNFLAASGTTEGNHSQVQREVRPHAELQPAGVVSVQPD